MVPFLPAGRRAALRQARSETASPPTPPGRHAPVLRRRPRGDAVALQVWVPLARRRDDVQQPRVPALRLEASPRVASKDHGPAGPDRSAAAPRSGHERGDVREVLSAAARLLEDAAAGSAAHAGALDRARSLSIVRAATGGRRSWPHQRQVRAPRALALPDVDDPESVGVPADAAVPRAVLAEAATPAVVEGQRQRLHCRVGDDTQSGGVARARARSHRCVRAAG